MSQRFLAAVCLFYYPPVCLIVTRFLFHQVALSCLIECRLTECQFIMRSPRVVSSQIRKLRRRRRRHSVRCTGPIDKSDRLRIERLEVRNLLAGDQPFIIGLDSRY